MLILGPTAMALGLIGAGVLGASGPIPGLLLAILLVGLGIGMCWAFTAQRAMGGAAPEEATIAASALPTVQQVGLALGGAADDGQQRTHVVFGEPDAVVAHDQLLIAAGGHDLDGTGELLAELGAGRHGVMRILQQLTQIDPLAAVEVMAEDLDEAPEINRELLAHALSYASGPTFGSRADPPWQ